MTTPSSQTNDYVFQAEINQLMSLIINSFYSNRDIFLRELISNASDAIDKHRYEMLTSGKNATTDYKIQIVPNKGDKTITIVDNGVGMTSEELISNLGTIARSGTKAFMEKMRESDNKESLIGQFGVGFYSAFLVANVVDVYATKDGKTNKWTSKADGTFKVSECDDDSTMEHGCKLVLHMKDDQCEYLEEHKIKELVKKYNGFINYPIELEVTKTVSKEVEVEPDTDTETGTGDVKIEDIADGDVKIEDITETAKKTTTIDEIITEFEKINTDKPIWTKKPEDVSEDEHNTFYKSITNDWDAPLAKRHFVVEGNLEFKCILYIPKKASYDLFDSKSKKQDNIKLYVKKVFVTDDSEHLSPEWMSFVKGIVDCDDLPLNISREFLQQNKILKTIKKNIVKRVVEMIQELNEEDSKTFYTEFSKSIKLGICNDTDNSKDKLSKLLKYQSSDKSEFRTLEQYVDNMKEDQECIYYLSGDNMNALKKSPFLDRFKKQGLNVLLMDEAIDEYLVQQLREFKHDDKTYKLQSINREGLTVPGEEVFQEDKGLEAFCKAVKVHYGDTVEKVKQTNALGDLPCSIVSSAYGWSANMERIMKAQALRNDGMSQAMNSKKIVELNVQHPLIVSIAGQFKSDDNKLSEINKNLLTLMLETSMLSSGYVLDDPHVYCQKIFKVMSANSDTEGVVEDTDTDTKGAEDDVDDTEEMEQVD